MTADQLHGGDRIVWNGTVVEVLSVTQAGPLVWTELGLEGEAITVTWSAADPVSEVRFP